MAAFQRMAHNIVQGPFCVEFVCNSGVGVGSLQVLQLLPTVKKDACEVT